MAGPQGSSLEGERLYTFYITLCADDKPKGYVQARVIPSRGPMSPTKVRFLPGIHHPNIDKLSRICLDILKGRSLFAALQVNI
jgi:hypothetical protein